MSAEFALTDAPFVSSAIRARSHGVSSQPWLLARIAAITDGASVRANTALIENNARTAGKIAVALVARAADRR